MVNNSSFFRFWQGAFCILSISFFRFLIDLDDCKDIADVMFEPEQQGEDYDNKYRDEIYLAMRVKIICFVGDAEEKNEGCRFTRHPGSALLPVAVYGPRRCHGAPCKMALPEGAKASSLSQAVSAVRRF